MSKLKHFVGIDISKLWFDAALLNSAEPTKVNHHQFAQNKTGFKLFDKWLLQNGVTIDEHTLFCMENTGLYSMGLTNHLLQLDAQIWVEMPLKIKKAGGFERGSDDKSASVKIAWYAMRFQDEVNLWKPADSIIQQLKNLIAQRDRIILSLNQLSVPVEELKAVGCTKEAQQMEKLQGSALNALQKSKLKIEAEIMQAVKQDQKVYGDVQRVKSVKGIGIVTAVALLVYTRNFKNFENAKQLACYSGVVPFTKSSGTSVKYKSTVSPYANKKLKKLLHMCALSSIRNDGEMKAYFDRKVTEGKNKMSVINAVRNKLLHRVYAVLRDERMYEDNYVRKCA